MFQRIFFSWHIDEFTIITIERHACIEFAEDRKNGELGQVIPLDTVVPQLTTHLEISARRLLHQRVLAFQINQQTGSKTNVTAVVLTQVDWGKYVTKATEAFVLSPTPLFQTVYSVEGRKD